MGPVEESLGQVEVDVEAVDHGVGQGGGDGVELAHQVEGHDDLGIFNLQDVDQIVSFSWVPWKLKIKQ